MKRIMYLFFLLVVYSAPSLAIPISLINAEGIRLTFDAELANTKNKRQKGLMFRTMLLPNQGMLLLYNKPTSVSMWMKNTPISLDMIFVDRNGMVQKVVAHTHPFSKSIIGPVPKTMAVLEVVAGTCEKYDIRPGSRVLLSSI